VIRYLLLLALATAPAAAQTTDERVYHIAELAVGSPALGAARQYILPFLAQLGFVVGRNLVLDEYSGDPDAMPRLAQQALAAHPDVFMTIGPDAVQAASAATKTVPIVSFGSDPVPLGMATSHAHPGGNVTGVVILVVELDAKRLDLLHEAVPEAHRVAVLYQSVSPFRPDREKALGAVAAMRGIELLSFAVSGASDYPTVFAAMREQGVQALVVTAEPMFSRDGEIIADLARKAMLPVICQWGDMARAGCLLGYGPDRGKLFERTAYLIGRIFHGAQPGELPIETPNYYEFVINQKTAAAIGVTVPTSLLVRADDVVE
jgi:putative ABC transport system substrate-binding protein